MWFWFPPKWQTLVHSSSVALTSPSGYMSPVHLGSSCRKIMTRWGLWPHTQGWPNPRVKDTYVFNVGRRFLSILPSAPRTSSSILLGGLIKDSMSSIPSSGIFYLGYYHNYFATCNEISSDSICWNHMWTAVLSALLPSEYSVPFNNSLNSQMPWK